GDSLAAFGISQLGARLYDPSIGRFISRDPLLIPRTASTTNPYAFADNDPVNASDPSGLQPALCSDGDPLCVTKSFEPAPTGGNPLQPTPPPTGNPSPDFGRWESEGRKVIPGDPWDGGQPS